MKFKLYMYKLTERFSEDSDVDFLNVDLTSEKDLTNPYFIKEVNATKQLIYG